MAVTAQAASGMLGPNCHFRSAQCFSDQDGDHREVASVGSGVVFPVGIQEDLRFLPTSVNSYSLRTEVGSLVPLLISYAPFGLFAAPCHVVSLHFLHKSLSKSFS